MRSRGLIPFSALLLFASVAFASQPPASVLGPGSLSNPLLDTPCGLLRINSDETYESAYAWQYGGQVPPYYGAFAEEFSGGNPEVCAVVLDLTTVNDYPPLCDLYVWADAGGIPGSVLCLTPDVNTGPVAHIPYYSRHELTLQTPCFPSGSWWAGFWGRWVGAPAFWVGADLDGPEGHPFTNIAPGIGYPTGWQHVDIVWGGHTTALGIGILAHTPLPSAVPDPKLAVGSWGKVKALYQ